MAKIAASRHPSEWAAAQFQAWSRPRASAPPATAVPYPRRIALADLRAALAEGTRDFLAFRSDVIVLCVLYPVAGALLWRFATGRDMGQWACPLIAGFALLGPLFATGLEEMSRQREQGRAVTWATAFEAFRAPGIGRIAAMGVLLMVVFVAWLFAAQLIYAITVAAEKPASFGAFAGDVLHTKRGVVMTVLGIDVGALFATLVLCISIVSFPLLLDRNVTVAAAITASLQGARVNPALTALWGGVVATGLVLGSIPFLIGLIITLPILGHASWHLYRKMIPF